MRVFIAGVMQANRKDRGIEDQNYRVQITEALQQHVPQAEIVDPWALNPGSVDYDDARARRTFLTMTRKAAEVDMLIAYLPQLSMGTAMEMWEACRADVYIVAVTPFQHHWAVRFTANEILPDLPALLAQIANGHVAGVLNGRTASTV